MITIWKLAPALATGNALIIKTPELSPLYGQKPAMLVKEAGFPVGVVNIIAGDSIIAGKCLSEHMEMKRVAYTGSSKTGRKVLQAAAMTNLKKVTLELGGKVPSIVFDDADFDNALFWTRIGIIANHGKVCAAGSRIYVQDTIYEKFIEAYTKAAAEALNHRERSLPPNKGKGPYHKSCVAREDSGIY
ncbi:hypothetical protein N7532_004143 [Penicillium argentinense]|uniref:aldehyde dehydrogenase (NAD(+)) n=1 Tax=Penicillium argentinense TaxID=1131581 RepID=A0A9W9FNT9_9EURO|nr:uncharacterized protein N7532_004143 [Penicillium argentinense]KAJ5103614.1 hypothetical protein N7532_004143 [Penicillium argentinense]